MRRRTTRSFRPDLERFEAKRLLSAGASARRYPPPAYTIVRITNPDPFEAQLKPPFAQVLVQFAQPVPGQVYNILFISVRNKTSKTFTAASGLTVHLSGGQPHPILTGDQEWVPNQVIVFYALTKKYYPPNPVVSSGFLFNFAGGTAVPGPSGIFQRVRYNPATFPEVLNYIVAYGPGSKGHLLGLPDTAIYEFLNAATKVEPL